MRRTESFLSNLLRRVNLMFKNLRNLMMMRSRNLRMTIIQGLKKNKGKLPKFNKNMTRLNLKKIPLNNKIFSTLLWPSRI